MLYAQRAGLWRRLYPYALWLILVAGLAERIVWLMARKAENLAWAEAANVAVAYARTGVLADPYGFPSGPTAHLTPVTPLIAGTVYRLLGPRSFNAELVLGALSISYGLIASALFYSVFRKLGTPRLACLLAVAVIQLVPLNMSLETIDFRAWEGGLAVMMAAAFLYLLVRQRMLADSSLGDTIVLALIAAVLILVSPPMGITVFASWAVLIIFRGGRGTFRATIAGAVALLIVIGPWTVRNYEQFGKLLPLRSNGGLEIAIANHPGALSNVPPKDVFEARLKEIHPSGTPEAFAKMKRAGGEVPYAEHLGAEAARWISANPKGFAELTLRHFIQFYFPPLWSWQLYGHPSAAPLPMAIITWAISAFGLLGVFIAALGRPRDCWLAIPYAIVPALPYAIVQPVLRYHYLVHAVLVFFALDGLFRMCSWAKLKFERHEPKGAVSVKAN